MFSIKRGEGFMKKKAVISLAVTAALASTLGFTACGGSAPYDREAPAFGDGADVTISVKAEKTSGEEGKISDTLFGVFLEDINFASYYLDDNLIANGSFEAITQKSDYAWTTINNGTKLSVVSDSNGIFTNTEAYKNQSVNPKYAKVTVSSAGEGGVKNTGYGGVMPFWVWEGTEYVFSAFIKNPNAAFDLTVSLSDGTKEYLNGKITIAQSNEWIKYTRTFTATGTKDSALQFNLKMPAGTDICLDAVSLETTDSTLGFKNTPYNAIKDLAPKFIRFPGGCIIEGNGAKGDECAYDWKNSIGAVKNGENAGDDILPAFTYKEDKNGSAVSVTTYGEAATRKPNPDLWAGGRDSATTYDSYYDMTYAIGFYDYFMLCDSLGASAVPVVNCGLSCQGGAASGVRKLAGRHNKGVADFIQDAIDLIEFAKGDTSTKWGKVRSDMGHPQPFEMSYIGIGNEQWGTQYYKDCYEKFLEDDAFMQALSDYSIKPIVGNCTLFEHCEQFKNGRLTGGVAKEAAKQYLQGAKPNRKIETMSEYGVVDQHYYVNYTTLLTHTDMYDHYIRPYDDEELGYEVFVGEYSANTASGDYTYNANQWMTALSEAAMMTGYERNGDVVKLAAYAPMFGLARGVNQWGTDMMYFTNTQLVLSANYYVQQLFMKNQGAYRIVDDNHSIEWHNDLSPTFELMGDKAGSKQKTTVNKLYYVASLAKNGDAIVKIVNVSGDTIKADLALSGLNLKGNADVTVLQCDDRAAKNSLTEVLIEPESFKIGAFGGKTIGYEVKPYSVTSITVHKK